MSTKIKIINIMSHPPAYTLVTDEPRPTLNWDTPNGRWVGIWGLDWHDLLGNEVLRTSDMFEYEVWQPDFRADRIYEHRFENGLAHKLFPAKKRAFLDGLKISHDLFSRDILQMLESAADKSGPLVLHLDASPALMSEAIVSKFHNNIPMVHQFYGDFRRYFVHERRKYFLKGAHTYLKTRWQRRYFSKLRNVLTCRIEGLDLLEKNLKAKIYTISWGIDFDFWSKDKSKEVARRLLNIPQDKFVMLSSSRLYPAKQIDKWIRTLGHISSGDFHYYVTGHGTEGYEKELQNLRKEMKLEDRVFFVGFVDVDVLKNYYLASDIFVTTSVSEMGPHSAELAMAMELPVMATDTGMVGLILKDTDCGVLLPIHDYDIWKSKIEDAINGQKIRPVPLEVTRQIFDGAKAIQEYKNIYMDAVIQVNGAGR